MHVAFWTAAGSGTFANAGSIAFVTPYACTAADLVMWDTLGLPTGGTWKYNVDNAAGGGLVTVGPGSTTVPPNGWVSAYRVPITGMSNAVHTIRMGASSVQGGLACTGVAIYDPTNNKTRGIGAVHYAANGYRMLDYVVSTGNDPVDRVNQWQGTYKSNSTTTVATGFGFPVLAHLAVVMLGINDCALTTSAVSGGTVQFRHALRRFIQALRRGTDTTASGGGPCSVLLVVNPNPDASNSDMTSGWFGQSHNWGLYVEEIYKVAQAYNCGVVNIHARWSELGVTKGFVSTTDPHPTFAGHADIAGVLSSVIV